MTARFDFPIPTILGGLANGEIDTDSTTKKYVDILDNNLFNGNSRTTIAEPDGPMTVKIADTPNVAVFSQDGVTVQGTTVSTYFRGDGSQLTNLPGGNYGNANVAAYLPTYTGGIGVVSEMSDVFIGQDAGANPNITVPAYNRIAIGKGAGNGGSEGYSIAIGDGAGRDRHGYMAIAIGSRAGTGNSKGIAIGDLAGINDQSGGAVALGASSGQAGQGPAAVAVGSQAGGVRQGWAAVSIGYQAGSADQGGNAIAIGSNAASNTQAAYAIAVGHHAGNIGQGSYAIAIGANAAPNNQPAQSIVINGTNTTLDSAGANTLVVKPMAHNQSRTGQAMCYNTTSGEVFAGVPRLPNYASLAELTTQVTDALPGSIAYDAGNAKIAVYNGTTWVNV